MAGREVAQLVEAVVERDAVRAAVRQEVRIALLGLLRDAAVPGTGLTARARPRQRRDGAAERAGDLVEWHGPEGVRVAERERADHDARHALGAAVDLARDAAAAEGLQDGEEVKIAAVMCPVDPAARTKIVDHPVEAAALTTAEIILRRVVELWRQIGVGVALLEIGRRAPPVGAFTEAVVDLAEREVRPRGHLDIHGAGNLDGERIAHSAPSLRLGSPSRSSK